MGMKGEGYYYKLYKCCMSSTKLVGGVLIENTVNVLDIFKVSSPNARPTRVALSWRGGLGACVVEL